MWRAGALALVVAAASCSSDGGSPTEWDVTGMRSERTVEITVWVGSSSCNEYDDIDVEEDEDRVLLTATVRQAEGQDCTDDLTSEQVVVELGSPLAGRTLTGCRPPEPVAHSGLDRVDDSCGTIVG